MKNGDDWDNFNRREMSNENRTQKKIPLQRTKEQNRDSL